VREVHVSAITDTIKKLCMEANWNLGGEMLRAFDKALTTERSPAGKQVLQILKQNAEMAATKKIAYRDYTAEPRSGLPITRCSARPSIT